MKIRIPHLLAGLAAGAAAAAMTGLAARPWFLRWGAVEGEHEAEWPGDELSPEPASAATRGITIHASAAAVWPWIVQIGQDRGGFYSYSWLENLFGARIHNADCVLPGLDRKEGDTVWMAPPERYGGRGCARVARLDPGRAMVLVSPADYERLARGKPAREGTWAFLLDPIDARNTRLIVRSRSGRREGPGRFLVFDPVHFIMERKMMLGIRDRAETAAGPRAIAA